MPITGLEPVNLDLMRIALYQLSYIGMVPSAGVEPAFTLLRPPIHKISALADELAGHGDPGETRTHDFFLRREVL